MGRFRQFLRYRDFERGKGGEINYEPEAVALFARFTTQPTETRKGQINTLIKALKTAGVWTKMDAFYILAAHNAQAARRNWLADQYNLGPVSAPAFTTDRGYQGDGAISYLDTGFNPVTAPTPKIALNDNHIAIWSRTNLDVAGATSRDAGNPNLMSSRRGSFSGEGVFRSGTSGDSSGIAGSYPGYLLHTRVDATQFKVFNGGVQLGSITNASSAMSSQALKVCAASGSFGINQIAACHVGAGLTQQNITDLFNAINTYMVAIGAA